MSGRLVLPLPALALVALLAAPRAARAADPAPGADVARGGDLVPRVEARLAGAGERAEPPELGDLGPDVDLALIDLVNDTRRPLPLRLRAVRALGRHPTEVGRDFLIRLLTTLDDAAGPGPAAGATPAGAEEDPRAAALRARTALARAAALTLGFLRSEEAVDAIERLLAHPDREVRLDAIAALALSARRSALEALEFRLPREKDADIKKKLRQQVTRLRALLGPERTAPPPRLHRAPLRPDGPMGGEREPIRP